MAHPETTGRLPEGVGNAFVFATFNALSYQIILGSPMVLYAKTLSASATVLGIIAGMMPLLVVFQIPAASHVGRVGYRRFVLAGWGTRVAFIFAMALLALAGGFVDAPNRLALMLVLLFGFNLSRGISSAAWLPWITSLVPLEVRGRFLSQEAVYVHVASAATFLLCAGVLAGEASWKFGVLFAFSAVAGAVSLVFLRRIPDVPVPEQDKAGAGPVPWLAMANHPPFRKLLLMNVAWAVSYGGLGAFTVSYLKESAGLAESTILVVSGLAFLGGLAGLLVFASRTDRLGSKPVLTFSLVIWLGVMVVWTLLAGGVLPAGPWVIVGLQLLMGFGYALVSMNNTRLAMVLVPVMGRAHFFAIYSVVANLSLGLAPVLWGVAIDVVGSRSWSWSGFNINRYTIFFGAVCASFGVTLALCRRLDEPMAQDMEALIRELLKSPQRFWLRLWPRGS